MSIHIKFTYQSQYLYNISFLQKKEMTKLYTSFNALNKLFQ